MSFRTARDLALVALMLLNGLRSREVLALQLEDLLFGEAQMRVHGKGARTRILPLPPETIRDSAVLAENGTSPYQCAGSIRLPERRPAAEP